MTWGLPAASAVATRTTVRVAWLSCLLAAVLAGCATPAPAPGEAPWTAGRLSLRVDATPERAKQSLGVAFEVRGTGEQGELRLTSPIGTQLAAARWARGVAVLRTPEGERSFSSLDELSREALGEALPLAALPDWLNGRPWTAATHTVRSDGFDQLGWRVQTNRLAEGWISARRDSPPAIELRARLDRGD